MLFLISRTLALLMFLLPDLVVGGPRSRDNRANAPRTELSHPCSRPISRHVRKRLEKEILRPSQKAGLDGWPRGCPLDPSRDLWGKHEQSKQRKRGSNSLWTCGLNGKVFKSEHYVDLHLERKHMNVTPRGGVCLADYCEVFDVCAGDFKYRRGKEKQESAECNNSTMADARKRCEEAVTKCFPLENEIARRFNAKFSKQLCRVLDCRIRAEQRLDRHAELLPVVVMLVFIALVGFAVFGFVVCCVDRSDDIFKFLVKSGLASSDWVRSATRTRQQARQTIGMDRTKGV